MCNYVTDVVYLAIFTVPVTTCNDGLVIIPNTNHNNIIPNPDP